LACFIILRKSIGSLLENLAGGPRRFSLFGVCV
jgi:hypothetical protein